MTAGAAIEIRADNVAIDLRGFAVFKLEYDRDGVRLFTLDDPLLAATEKNVSTSPRMTRRKYPIVTDEML